MPLVLLKIGGTDLTPYIDKQNYEVNNVDEFEEWTDANHVKHRHVIRQRLSGNLSIGFRSTTEITNFLTLMGNNLQSGGYYNAQIFANDDNTLHTTEIFIDDISKIKRDVLNGRIWQTYELTVEER